MLIVQQNRPDPGDDPENRYDCDGCAHAPDPTEIIVIVYDATDEIDVKLCAGCAEERISAGVDASRDEVGRAIDRAAAAGFLSERWAGDLHAVLAEPSPGDVDGWEILEQTRGDDCPMECGATVVLDGMLVRNVDGTPHDCDGMEGGDR